jgi:hypothetical protein
MHKGENRLSGDASSAPALAQGLAAHGRQIKTACIGRVTRTIQPQMAPPARSSASSLKFPRLSTDT